MNMTDMAAWIAVATPISIFTQRRWANRQRFEHTATQYDGETKKLTFSCIRAWSGISNIYNLKVSISAQKYRSQQSITCTQVQNSALPFSWGWFEVTLDADLHEKIVQGKSLYCQIEYQCSKETKQKHASGKLNTINMCWGNAINP